MTSVFEGLGAAVNAAFGAPVTITPQATGAAVTVQGAFRFVMVDDAVADGRGLMRQVPVLRVPANLIAKLQRGDLVQPSNFPGRSFTVLENDESGDGATDGNITYPCEEVL